jgi:hypothetical protein
MKVYNVVVAWIGECCLSAHAALYRELAESESHALQKVKRRLTRQGKDVGDTFTVPDLLCNIGKGEVGT